jgi:tetratricopeptide (TPR) repeat protein/transcriptional regulator with XRE-family HTH domain
MSSLDIDSFGAMLKAFRTRGRLTQQQLADKLGIHRNTIGTWERGDYLPESKGLVLELARLLHLNDSEARQLLEASFTTLAPHWSVPMPRNPLFTGREEILDSLHARLRAEQVVALTQAYALHGLGGIGKTQLALEYTYRHALEYSAVCWIAAETIETVVSSLVRMAELFQLPERQEPDQQRIVAAVQRWLTTHSQWLLIWDNLEELDLLPRFLPSLRQGAVLITTRSQALGSLAQGVDLLPMEQEEGRLLLLRRAKMLGPKATTEQMQQLATSQPTENAAGELVTVLGGLPLALDQAGAYIEETGCSLANYLRRYEQQRVRLLDRCGGPGADLLRVCAFLYAEAIPEELFGAGAKNLGAALAPLASDPTQFDQAVAVLRNLSLVQRHPETQTLSLHRLVQAVIREQMSEQEQAMWLQRVIKALNSLFPKATLEAWEGWKQDERFLPHVLAVATAFPAQEGGQELAEALQKAAEYLLGLAQYEQAESLYQRAIRVGELALGTEHPQVATSLNGLGRLYREHGKQKQAEALFQRALTIQAQALGREHPQVAYALNNLAEIYGMQGKYEQAELFYQRALVIWEQALGREHPRMCLALNGLAKLYRQQRRDEQAEALFQRALSIQNQHLSQDHPYTAETLHNLALLRQQQGNLSEALSLAERALKIRSQVLGEAHPNTVATHTLHTRLLQEQEHTWEDAASPDRAHFE